MNFLNGILKKKLTLKNKIMENSTIAIIVLSIMVVSFAFWIISLGFRLDKSQENINSFYATIGRQAEELKNFKHTLLEYEGIIDVQRKRIYELEDMMKPQQVTKFPIDPKSAGIIDKYVIMRSDGTPISKKDEYFVLKVLGEGDPIHIKACRKAVLFYAKEIKNHLPLLSQEIIKKYSFRAKSSK